MLPLSGGTDVPVCVWLFQVIFQTSVQNELNFLFFEKHNFVWVLLCPFLFLCQILFLCPFSCCVRYTFYVRYISPFFSPYVSNLYAI